MGTPPVSSRRTVLKSLGAAAAATTVPFAGTASAATDASYYAAFHMPMLFDKSTGTPVDPDAAGTVRGRHPADGIVVPNGANTVDCSILDCSNYVAKIPWFFHWATDADPSDVGDVYFNVSTSKPTNGPSLSYNGWSTTIDSTEHRLTSTDAAGGRIEVKYPNQTGKPQNYFQPTYFRVELDFRDSNIRDGTVSETFQLSTPARGLLGAANLISATDTLYNAFVDTADQVVPTDLGKLRKATRVYAYAASTGDLNLLDPASNELAYEAMRSGIAAFQGPIEDRQGRTIGSEDNAVSTMGGPGMIELNDTGCDEGVPQINGTCPTDPGGDGLYEDVNGNGEEDFGDVVDYFQNISQFEQAPDKFDFNGNGQVDFGDLVTLFQSM